MSKKKYLTQRGQTLVEMVVTTFIIAIGLIAILSFFIVSRQGVTSSWRYTQKNELASQVMEQLKATPYATLKSWEQTYRVGGQAKNINPRNFVPPWDFGPEYQNYEIRIDLLKYKDYSLDQLMHVVVRVRESPSSPWLEKGSIIRMGE